MILYLNDQHRSQFIYGRIKDVVHFRLYFFLDSDNQLFIRVAKY